MVMSQTGRNDSGMDPFGPNLNAFLIETHPYSNCPPCKSKNILMRRSVAAAQQPHSKRHLQHHAADHRHVYGDCDSARLPILRSSSPVVIYMSCAAWPAVVLDVIRTIPGAADTSIEQEADQPQLRITIDRTITRAIRRQCERHTGGHRAGYRRSCRRFGVRGRAAV